MKLNWNRNPQKLTHNLNRKYLKINHKYVDVGFKLKNRFEYHVKIWMPYGSFVHTLYA